MKHNVRRAKIGRAWHDRLGHFTCVWDGDVDTWGMGWVKWPVGCATCAALVGQKGTFAYAGTIGHRTRHVGKVILSEKWTFRDIDLRRTLP